MVNRYKNPLAENARVPLLGYSAAIGLSAGLITSAYRI